MLTCTIVPRETGLVFVARVMTPAVVFRDCLDNTSCSHSVSRAYVPPSAESPKDASVLQLVSCFCRHRASWSVGTSRQAFALHWSTGQRNSWSHPFVWTLLASPRYLRKHNQMLSSRHLLQLPLQTQTALQDCLWPSCPRLLSSRHLISLVPNVSSCFELMAGNLLHS